jgi:hypothetical protein
MEHQFLVQVDQHFIVLHNFFFILLDKLKHFFIENRKHLGQYNSIDIWVYPS